ncbi:hypothetical protein RJ641_029162 [Dillenia turbinata]|uniref:Uncharacterized protein n=1 Tax=Dillenia turbinata TaxID=194707 RepID=A0AAN8ZIY0_9MAGN
MATSATVKQISECYIKPREQDAVEEIEQPIHLGIWDLAMLSVHYIQKGLLYSKPQVIENQEFSITALLERLKESLSIALVHFYPLAGHLATLKNENPPSRVIFVDCKNSPGAKFIHASLDLTISDILSPTYVPLVVQSFFDHDRAINHDGHSRSLLSIQVTELIDGVFIGCSINHAIVDGTSYWHFFNMWSEIFQALGKDVPISRPPILKRWFPEGSGPIINLPFAHQDEFISRCEAPELTERIFHFSVESIAKIKSKANVGHNTKEISSFQALSAFVWRSITRARCFPPDQTTICRIAINNRSRMNPPLQENYFGNAIQTVGGVTTAGELLEQDLGWAAWLLHQAVINHTNEAIHEWLGLWLQNPFLYEFARFFASCNIMMGSSPRFNKYGNEFGMGKALAIRSGYANKFDGKVSVYPGREGGGSVDLEVCLSPATMSHIEMDEEFMGAVFSSN